MDPAGRVALDQLERSSVGKKEIDKRTRDPEIAMFAFPSMDMNLWSDIRWEVSERPGWG